MSALPRSALAAAALPGAASTSGADRRIRPVAVQFDAAHERSSVAPGQPRIMRVGPRRNGASDQACPPQAQTDTRRPYVRIEIARR